MSWLVVPDAPYAVATTYLPDEALAGLDYKRSSVKGTPITLVQHDYAAWRTLRSRGMVVPSPLARYTWPGPHPSPRASQVATAEHFITHDKAFCLNGLRTGKTMSAIWAMDYLMQEGAVRRALIVCPKFIMDIVWERALFQALPNRRPIVLHGTRKRKQQMARDTRFDILIVNPESLHLIMTDLPDVDLVIVDEFTRFKNVRSGGKKSRRYDALEFISMKRRLWMLSGTPAPQSPLDAYGPIRLINPRRVSFTQWRSMTMIKLSEFRYGPQPGAADVIARWMQPAVRFKREDCIEIPDVDTEILPAALSTQQRKVIQEFIDDAAAQVASGIKITAANAAGVSSKILQVMAGGVYGEDPEGERATYHVDASPYLEAVEGVVQEDDGPVIVFASYQCSVDVTATHLEKQGYRVGSLTRGKAICQGKLVKSMELFDAFQRGELDALVAIPSTMQFGLDLTTCHTVVWATPPYSYEQYEQGNARVTGDSQKRKVSILHLVQSPITQALFQRLKSRETLQNTVLDLVEGRITV